MVFPAPQVRFSLGFINWAASKIPCLGDSGLSGYLLATVNSPPPVLLPGLPDKVASLMGNTIILDTHDPAEVNKIFQLLNDTIHERYLGRLLHWFFLSRSTHSWIGTLRTTTMAKPAARRISYRGCWIRIP